ncbi:mechanosensitive ion channel family protein [candidate division KSB1 bacterium]|nr:mechanosensitive ion channel family protein [candidate division KSB1 bacterium]
MKKVYEWLILQLQSTIPFQDHLLGTVFTIFFLWLLARFINFIINRRTQDVRVQYTWRKAVSYSSFVLGIFFIGRIWFAGFQSLSTFLGLFSAGLAIALKTPLENMAGWLFILWRRPFHVGDRIQLGEYRGDVIDQRIFMFSLMEIGNWVDADQSTGRVIHVPNGKIFNEALANYSAGFQYIWHEIPVLVTFESNWKKVKKILLEIATEHAEHLSDAAEKSVKQAAKKFLIFYNKLTPTVYTSVRDSGVLLTIRYLCEPRRRRSSEQEIWEDILEKFSENDDIDFAYPTRRFFDHDKEGKKE